MKLQLVQQTATGLNHEALEEWKAYREEDLHKPLTPRALKMVIKKLLQWSETEQMRIVENAIENNWRGLYYTEPPKANSTRSRSLEQDLMDKDWAR